ncbi:Uncharacterised protein [Nocardia otitidiscaviarum]|uniref:Uncharacterized protein n=1 Tax=Nocardia otitidiscaviarum TaxID=1823 RepID=A0A378YK53_9NOCA|nr:Uncharacterised protein [Nocardia otitidiscaviarum]
MNAGTIGWNDLFPFAATALAAVLGLVGVLVTSLINRRSAVRPSAYERLDKLLKARSDWPDDLEGRDIVDRTIRYLLLDIRNQEHVWYATSTGALAAAEYRYMRTRRLLGYVLRAVQITGTMWGIIAATWLAVIAVLLVQRWGDNLRLPELESGPLFVVLPAVVPCALVIWSLIVATSLGRASKELARLDSEAA